MGTHLPSLKSNLQIRVDHINKNHGVRRQQVIPEAGNRRVDQEQAQQGFHQAIRQECRFGNQDPKDARSLAYVDKKCPFTGNVAIRGRLLTGVVTKLKMQRSCTIRRDYLHYIKKYARFEKRHKMVSAHVSPCFRDIAVGDLVTVGECRPLAKTVKFNVIKINKTKSTKKGFSKF